VVVQANEAMITKAAGVLEGLLAIGTRKRPRVRVLDKMRAQADFEGSGIVAAFELAVPQTIVALLHEGFFISDLGSIRLETLPII
jgi:hypothetical protein